MVTALENLPLVHSQASKDLRETCCKTKRCPAYMLPLAIHIPNLQAPIGMPKFTLMSSRVAALSKWMASPLCVTANSSSRKPATQARLINGDQKDTPH